MDIYTTREVLKNNLTSIFDLNLRVAYYARVSTEKEEQKEEGRRARQGEGKPSDHRQGRRCGAGIQPRHRRQGIYRPRRSVRLRQIDDAAYDRRSRGDH